MRDFVAGTGFDAVLPGEKHVRQGRPDTSKEISIKIRQCEAFMGATIKKLTACMESMTKVSSGEELNKAIDRWQAILKN